MSDGDVVASGELRASVALLRALLEHSSDMVTVLDADGVVRDHYPPGVLGYDEGENFGRQVFDFLHPDDIELALTRFAESTVTPGVSTPFECRARGADDEWRDLEIVATNLLDDPIVNGVVLNIRDITERRRAEDAQRQSEQRFRALVDHSTDMIFLLDELGNIQYTSPAVERVLGYTDGALIGRSGFDLVYADDQELGHERLTEAVLGEGITRPVELRIAHVDGSWRNVELIGNNLLADPVVNAIVLNGRDVTDRRRAEEAVRASEERFRALVQHGYDIIALVDADSRIQYVSPSVTHRLGYTPDELVGNVGFRFVYRDDMPAVTATFAKVVEAPGVHGPMEMRSRHADGSWHWLEIVYTNLLDDPVVRGVVCNFRDVTERKLAEEELAHQALHDPLTALPNRVLLMDRLEQAIARADRTGRRVGVVFLDLDRFKLVNDTRGHRVGDELLIAVGRLLRTVVRSSDTVARFGGDEFVVLGDELVDPDEATRLAEHVQEALREPFSLDSGEVYATASLGVVVGEAGASADALLRDADAAMYRAKERGGARVEVFDEALRRRAEARVATESGLRHAVERDELRLVFQPVVSLPDGGVIGAEALVRWQHPQRGMVNPLDFIPLAEETGLIGPIGHWVLEQACSRLREWQDRLPILVAINCSPTQLRSREFAKMVREVVTRAGVPPSMLTLEMTEGVLMDGGEESLAVLHDLTELGVRLAIDDFGTRYASLGYLARFPIDVLKIDQSFVAKLGTGESGLAIVSAIMAMADSLDLTVVAEGVETPEQARTLHALGCRFAQGFHFARPMPADDFTALLDGSDADLAAERCAQPVDVSKSSAARRASVTESTQASSLTTRPVA